MPASIRLNVSFDDAIAFVEYMSDNLISFFLFAGVFLICWVPFFTCNIMDAMCTKLGRDCQPGVTAFILTTWLGYMNSFVNPVIYTIFNPEFRKAFKKIMHLDS